MRYAGRIGFVVALAVGLFAVGGVGLFRQLRSTPAPSAPAQTQEISPIQISGSLPQLITSLQQQVRQVPGDWRSAASLGVAYIQEARVTADPSYYPKAQAILETSLRIDPTDNASAMIGMSALSAARHDFSGALHWGERAKAIDPYDANVYAVIGDAQTELGDYPQAFATYQHMVNILPALPSYARVSYARELMGDVRGAIVAMKQAAGFAGSPSDSAWADNQLGDLYFNSGRLSQASRYYRTATQADSTYVPPVAGLAKVAWAEGHTSQAISGYKDVISRYPLPDYVIALTDIYLRTGQKQLAAQEEAVLHTEEELFVANGVNIDLEQALFDASHGEPQQGLEAARAEWQRRHSILVADAYAWALYENGDYTDAARFEKIAMHVGMRNALFYFHQGMIQLAFGDKGAARAALSTAGSINPWFSIEYSSTAKTTLARLGGPA